MSTTGWIQTDDNTWNNPNGAVLSRDPVTGVVTYTRGTNSLIVARLDVVNTFFPPRSVAHPGAVQRAIETAALDRGKKEGIQ